MMNPVHSFSSGNISYELVKTAKNNFEKGNIKAAEEGCVKALLKDPEFYPAFNLLGSIYAQKPSGEGMALRNFIRSLKIKPDQPNIYGKMAFLYEKMGDLEKSVEALEKALLLEPDNEEFNYTLGLIYFSKKGGS